MKVIDTTIPDVKIIEPEVFGDDRGFFYESFNRKRFREHTGLDTDFVQDNHSKSGRGVLRGLHYQIEQAQGKLVRVVRCRGRYPPIFSNFWPVGRHNLVS
jgi:dTDP-4-dehydrorhamnose 3,5-epimerase